MSNTQGNYAARLLRKAAHKAVFFRSHGILLQRENLDVTLSTYSAPII